jgi:hypothetical protein
VTILIVFLTGLVALVCYAYYRDKYGKSYWGGKTLSQSVVTHYFNDGKSRVYNTQTRKYTTAKLRWVSDAPVDDSLAVYAVPNKRGFINVNTGNIAIDAETNNYSKAWVFSEGLAAVVQDGKIGFINALNEVVIPFKFDYSTKCRMYDVGYLFHNGYCIMTNANGDLGLIDRAGNWVVEPTYDEVWAPHESGYRIVVKENRYGVLDSKCAMTYPVEYGYITIASDGFVLTKCGRMWKVDFVGNVVQPFMYSDTSYINYPIGYNDNGEVIYAISNFAKYEILGCYGVINLATGEPITPAIYSAINVLTPDLLEVQYYDSYDWYLIDSNGNAVYR